MKIVEKLTAKKDIYNQSPVTIAFLGGSFVQGCFECYVDEGKIATVCEYKNSFSTSGIYSGK
jgi:hypothetical protein